MELRFFEIYRNPEYLWLLAEGVGMSAGLTLAGATLGFMLAVGLALSRFERVPVLRWVAAAWVDFIRNTPLIVQLFFVAFGLPLLLGYVWPFWAHAVLALTINFSAYFAEILRAGFQTVDQGQKEAAQALGVGRFTRFVRIVLPQSIAQMFASLNSQFIFLFLTTGVISEIGVRDLTFAGLYIDSRTFRSFEVYISLTVLYILLSLAFKALMQVIEVRAFRWKTAR
ncbi:amino acid ABC transporter permease [Maritimibacter sp. UBA3975]|uniref:amino acid ABC transporter permease n=1 Tax=Maritimibacter sp. UBA3975 TaxID=1946833 RepID=UPI000C0AF100|nr:amino acid ABC transporter permease [Maritimibacter sp. UBA3975]MAM62500.1 amino acid ABC transporter permease [Maritimibacter sp.]|tara:strand:+ start:5952 stop:6629 length:678 start_codon:yes stop_codon:yes gene_type:complete